MTTSNRPFGIVFDIKEFAIHDGPGIRTTVFLKGCPLHCSWCHNPEGLSSLPQTINAPSGTRIVGKKYSAEELATRLNKQSNILRANKGGVTFSGGEPLFQAEFVANVIDLLDNIHVLLDTSGYGNEHAFRGLVSRSDLVYFDLKIMDPEIHRLFTGCDNSPILSNLHILSELNVPFVIRVPLIPGVTDTNQNLSMIAETASALSALIRIDLLPYNKLAGAKYKDFGMVYKPNFDETRPLNINKSIFQQSGLEVKVA